MDIFEQLRRDEDVRKFIYTDTHGKLTIGVGRNLTDDGVSDAEIDFMLQNDVKAATDELHARLPWFQALDPARQAVLVNMNFNMGFIKLEAFAKFLRATAQGDWNEAAKEMLDSVWAKQVGDRATRLAHQMLDGQWT